MNVTFENFASCNTQRRHRLLQDVKRIEKKTFPASEVLDFDSEVSKKNAMLQIAIKTIDEVDEVVAYIVIVRVKRTALLHKVCVAPQHRRQGIGQRNLLDNIQRLRVEACTFIQLWVDDTRLDARALYTSLGFGEVRRCQDYYGPGRTGIKMELSLE